MIQDITHHCPHSGIGWCLDCAKQLATVPRADPPIPDTDPQPEPRPEVWKTPVYTIKIYLGEQSGTSGEWEPCLRTSAEDDLDLAIIMRRLTFSYCADPDTVVRCQIRDQVKDVWHNPAQQMPDDWDGVLPMEGTAHVGSANF